VDGLARRVVGVLPPEFRFLSSRSQIFLPWASNVEDRKPRRRHWGSSSQMIARLQPGASLAQAQTQLDAHNAAQEADAAEARMMAEVGFRTLVVPLHADHVAALRSTLLLVQGAALLLLLIAVYYPYRHWSGNSLFLVARTSQPPDRLGKTLQDVVRQVDPELPLSDLRSMETRLADSLLARRSPALLAGSFSAVAVLLTAVGTVAQRSREIGLRMALGARPQQIRGQFVRLALQLLAAGIALGLGGAWLTGRAMQVVLFQVPPLHLPTLAGTAVTITVVSLCACLLPAHRAAHVSPMETLAND